MRYPLCRIGVAVVATVLSLTTAVAAEPASAARATAGTAASVTSAAAELSPSGDRGSAGGDGDYLALGDSVPFGYNPLLPLGDPGQYVGYPELAAPMLDLALTNLSCPGQASGGFRDLDGADNGCFTFREHALLHTSYGGTQFQAALRFLVTHPKTRLVTIMLGANDLFLCVSTTADGCTSRREIAATLTTLSNNLTVALSAIRTVYHGRLVAVTYYTPGPGTVFSDPAYTAPILAADRTLARVAAAFGGTVANGYTAFTKRSGGSACAAGLLIRLPDGSCDIHPSAKGARVLAGTVVKAADLDDHDGGRKQGERPRRLPHDDPGEVGAEVGELSAPAGHHPSAVTRAQSARPGCR